MKDLILITSYCPDSEKKEMLFEFLKSLQKFRNEYDIFLSSHLPIDNFYFNYVDYFYYDNFKQNNVSYTIQFVGRKCHSLSLYYFTGGVGY